MKKNVLLISLLAGILASTSSFAAFPGQSPATIPSRGPVSPEDAGALHDTILNTFLASDWETLSTDLSKQTRTISAMTKDQQADVAYIRQAASDGRPAWWNQVKQGGKIQITAKLWQGNLTATWDPSANGFQVTTGGGQHTVVINWPEGDMDSPTQAEHGFTKGDLAYVTIWSTLESAQVYGQLSYVKLNGLAPADNIKLLRYITFRGMLAAAYYGTPRARRWAVFLSLDAYLNSHLNNEGFIQRKAFGAMVVAEIAGHPWKYPSFRIPRNINPENPEGALANSFMTQFERVTLTFPEDKALREAVKEFAAVNSTAVYTAGKATLPNKLPMPLDPADDAKTSAARNKWLLDQLQNPETRPAVASTTRHAP